MSYHYHNHAHHCIHLFGWVFIALSWIWLFTDPTLFWIFMGVGFFLIFLGAFVHYVRLRQLRRHYYDCSTTYPIVQPNNGGYPAQGYNVYQSAPPIQPVTPYQPNPSNYETPKPQEYYTYQAADYSNPYPQQPQAYPPPQVYAQPQGEGMRPPPQVYNP